MENLLLIEVFNKRVKSIYKTKCGSAMCEKYISDELHRNIHKIKSNLLIKIYGTFDINGKIFFPGNALVVDIYDYQKKARKNDTVTSTEDLLNMLTNIEVKERCRKPIFVKDYNQIIFDKNVFMTILVLTQQFFWYDEVSLDKKLNMSVITTSGIQSLFVEGNSMKIMEPLIGIAGVDDMDKTSIDTCRGLWVINLNNCATCINIANGNYYLNLEVENSNGFVDNIYLIRSCKEFWTNLKVFSNDDDSYFILERAL